MSAQHALARLKRLLLSIVEAGAARGIAISAILAGLGAAVSLGMVSALAQSMPEAEFGIFVGWMNTLLFLAVVAAFGQETMFIRSWNEFIVAGRFDRAKGLLIFGLGTSLIGWFIVTLVLSAAAWWLDLGLQVLLPLLLFLLAQTLCLITSQAARITAGIVAGVLHREITWRCIILLVLAYAAWLAPSHTSLSPSSFFLIAAGGLFLGVLLQVRSTFRALPPQVFSATAEIDVAVWSRRSARMWLAALLEAASQFLDVALVAIILSPRDAAIYFACQKFAAIFFILADAFGLYSSRQISSLYYSGSIGALQDMLRHLSVLMLPLCLIGMVLLAVGGSTFLQIFGASYSNHVAILLLLSSGTAIFTLGGPASNLLMLTGHETAYLRTLAIGTLVRYAGVILAGTTAGLVGAAFANAAALIAITLVLSVLCRSLIGVDPSVLSLLSWPRAHADANQRNRTTDN